MGWVSAIISGVNAGIARGEAQNAAIKTTQLSGEQADVYYRFGEYNAQNIEKAGAESDRRASLNEEAVRSATIATSAASGFTLSGTPQDYLDRQRQIFGEELSYQRGVTKASATQTRDEANSRAQLALRYGAQAAQIQINQGNAAALNNLGTGIGTFAKLYNPNNDPGAGIRQSGGGVNGIDNIGGTSGGTGDLGNFGGADVGGVGGAPY